MQDNMDENLDRQEPDSEQSFEEQFRAAVDESLGVKEDLVGPNLTEEPAEEEIPDTPEMKIKKSRRAKMPMFIGIVLCVLCVGIGAVLAIVNPGKTATREELLSQEADLRKVEEEALETTGFSDEFYTALANTSGVMDDLYAMEDAEEAGEEVKTGFMQAISHSGAVYFFLIAVLLLAAGMAASFIMSRKVTSSAANTIPVAMCLFALLSGFAVISTHPVWARSTTGADVTLIGDSLSARATNAGSYAKFLPDADIHAQGSKHFYYTVHEDNPSGISILRDIISRNELRDILVFELGTNDIKENNQYWPGGSDLALTEQEILEVVNMVGSETKIVFFTNYSQGAFDFTSNNALFRKVASEHSNVYLGDWEAYAKTFNGSIMKDDVHPIEGEGTDVFAQFVRDTINTIPDDKANEPVDRGDPLSNSGGALKAISFEEFSKNTDYINKLVPGSDDPNAYNYYASMAFQNSGESYATFDTADGGITQVHENNVGFACNILGVKNYMVDFTNADRHFTNITRSSHPDTNANDVRTRAEKAAMMQNTLYLQLVEYCAAGSGITITVPKGEYFFLPGHLELGSFIYPVDNVNISGRGIGNYQNAISTAIKDSSIDAINQATSTTTGNNATIFYPYTQPSYNQESAPDMFSYNKYRRSGFTEGTPLKNISYRKFIVDGANAVGTSYTSGGKGFMYNVFQNVNWDTMVVRNTDGTGFGIDCAIGNGNYIKNSLAMNNGKKALSASNEGASGFGIGAGYRSDESFRISNSVAYANSKFGYFFEHQNRFQVPGTPEHPSAIYPYDAIAGGSSNPWLTNMTDVTLSKKAFEVSNSLSVSNMYNYGGMRSYDMNVVNSTSIAGSTRRNQGTYYEQTTTTVSNVYYSSDSRRLNTTNVKIKSPLPSDVSDSSQWYYPAVRWAYENGITYGVANNRFGTGEYVTRGDALTLLWRFSGNPGPVVTRQNGNQHASSSKSQYVVTCFDDIAPESDYAGPVYWAYTVRYNPNSNATEKGRITVGTKGCEGDHGGLFEPRRAVTRAEFVTMLWRMAGEPRASDNASEVFTDIPEDAYYKQAANWATATGITNGTGNYHFSPDSHCTREQAVTFLYRYYQKFGKP